MRITRRIAIGVLVAMLVFGGMPIQKTVYADDPNIVITNSTQTPTWQTELLRSEGMTPTAAVGYCYTDGHAGSVYYECDMTMSPSDSINTMQVKFSLGGGVCKEVVQYPLLSARCGGYWTLWVNGVDHGSAVLAGFPWESIAFAPTVSGTMTQFMVNGFNEHHGGHLKVTMYADATTKPMAWHDVGRTWGCNFFDIWMNKVQFFSPIGVPIQGEGQVADFEWKDLVTDGATTTFTPENIGDYGITGTSVTSSSGAIVARAEASWKCDQVVFKGLYFPKDDPMPAANVYETTEGWVSEKYLCATTEIQLPKRGWWELWFKEVDLAITTIVWLKVYNPNLPGDDPDSYDPIPEDKGFWQILLEWFEDFWGKVTEFFGELFGPPDLEHTEKLAIIGEDIQDRFPFSIITWGAGVVGTMSVTSTAVMNLDFQMPDMFGIPGEVLHIDFDDFGPFWTAVRGIFTAGLWLSFAYLAIVFIKRLWL